MKRTTVLLVGVLLCFAVTPCRAECPPVLSFTVGPQTLGNTRSFGIAIADIDLDGDNDVFVPNYHRTTRLWLNDGNGTFAPSAQVFSVSSVHDVAVGDLNGDSFADVFLLSNEYPSKIYFGDGAGTFTRGAQNIGDGLDLPCYLELGDVDRDGDLDALNTQYASGLGHIRVWLNDGLGVFSSDAVLGSGGASGEFELVDLNGDACLDLFITLANQGDEVWLNDGAGSFVNSGQVLGANVGWDYCANGDVDGDGDKDIVVSNSVEGIKIWLNQHGTGSFVEAGSSFEVGAWKVELFDADGDRDLDLASANRTSGNKLWKNDGSGRFALVGTMFGTLQALEVAWARIDNDSDIDVVLGLSENQGGNPIYFNQTDSTCYGLVTDIDGNDYRTVRIGDQVWMAENLKVTHYRNGDPVSYVFDSTGWVGHTLGAYCDYGNDTSNVGAYGHLYNWFAATDSRGIAPEGWHVASDSEWQALVDHQGGSAVAGGRIKEAGTLHWLSPNTVGTNACGFAARPGGYRGSALGIFADLGNYATFWTSSAVSDTYGWYWSVTYDLPEAGRYDSRKYYGFSVRCVKDQSCCRLRGDANGDGKVIVSDLTFLVNFLFKGGAGAGCTEHADVNGDVKVIVSDLTCLVNYLFRAGAAPAACA